jgi:hypothetical protein
VSLWEWIRVFPTPSVATPATLATNVRNTGELSQLSQLSQGVAPAEKYHDDQNAREAFEERAAIMEFDGGLSRSEAEQSTAGAPDARHAQAAALALHAVGPMRWRGEGLDLGDLRPCLWCRNFTRSGRCLAAWRGELRAAHDWVPTFPEMGQRCVGYKPPNDDPDQRPGRERWPEMIEWQSRR